MQWHERIRTALTRAGHTPDYSVVEELAQHARAMYDAARADGSSAADAERRVELQIALWAGDATLMTRRHGTIVVPAPELSQSRGRIAAVMQDARYAARLLRRRPGATLVTILTMALGIGATTVLFSVVWGVLFKPLPWPHSERLIRLAETREGGTNRMAHILTNGTYLAWRDAASTIEELGGWTPSTVTLTGTADPQRVSVVSVTPSIFPMLSARPWLGRVFEDVTGENAQAVVLSHAFWQQLGADRSVLGRVIQLDGQPRTVIGVMPAEFGFPDRDTRAWMPLDVRPVIGTDPDLRSLAMFSAIARLKPGVTAAQAAEEATARGRTAPDPGLVTMAVFGSNGPVVVTAMPMLEYMTKDVRDALLVFLAAVGLLLVTATANVASVQLARSSTRRREMAIRSALGAQSGRLARQLLVESVLLGLLGGVAGLLVAMWIHTAMPSVLPSDFPRADSIAMDLRVMAFAIAASLAASILFGLVPALQARRINVVESLTEDGSAPVGGARRTKTARARASIMIGQVAVASMLLVGASLLIRTFVALLNADRGYDVTNVLVARVPMGGSAFTSQRRAQVVGAMLERLESTPGVKDAGFTSVIPLLPMDAFMGFTLPPAPGATEPTRAQAALRTISHGYPQAIGMRLAEGRYFTDADTESSQPVILVNRTFSERFLGSKGAGTRLAVPFDPGKANWEIAGVLEDVRMHGASDPPQPEIFMSYRQVAAGIRTADANIVVRTTGDPVQLVPALRSIVSGIDPTLALDAVSTMEQRLLGNLARPRLYAILLGGFAAFALVIAAVGLFGVLSYTVAQRSRELAVRTALGARPIDNLRLVLRQGLTVTLIGIAAGLVLSALGARTMSSFLFGVTAHDRLTYVFVPLVLLAVASVACFVPAWRASRIDPLRVLKSG